MPSLVSSSALWTGAHTYVAIGTLATLLILLWDWRFSLLTLALVQLGVGQLMVAGYEVPQAWAFIHFFVVALSCLLLALSAWQVRLGTSITQAGSWFFRAMGLLLVGMILRHMEFDFVLPEIGEPMTQLLLWLSICAIMILTLTDGPLFSGVGLLLWLIPVQAVVAVLLPIPILVAMLGSLTLIVALACSYLVLAEDTAPAVRFPPMTDLTFPDNER